MFANVLRSQARLSLVRAARVALPATRSISSLLAMKAATPIASRFAVRTFSNTMRTSDRPRNPPSNTIFIGNVPWETTPEELATLFSDFGTIDGEVRMPVDNQGRPRGFAHITFVDESSAITAVNSAMEEPLHIAGRDLSLDFATNSRRAPPTEAPAPNNKVYFANFEGGENGLRTLFKDFEGDILSVFMLRDGNTGASLPSGFVEFSDVDVATNVIEQFNGTQLPSGSRLEISYARPRKPRQEARFENRRQDNRRSGQYTNRGYQSNQRNYD
ncbi:RNA-binding domain-containing protein [Pholiota conissans]|uniref:RNA-binding domain-containing protein n=1 Tax=Pholiota conissans TaxID=109636 RepID=A0A9P5YY04_9AGAR|nr:RNA-binding domain-containing protein [Pholiota conissans]